MAALSKANPGLGRCPLLRRGHPRSAAHWLRPTRLRRAADGQRQQETIGGHPRGRPARLRQTRCPGRQIDREDLDRVRGEAVRLPFVGRRLSPIFPKRFKHSCKNTIGEKIFQ